MTAIKLSRRQFAIAMAASAAPFWHRPTFAQGDPIKVGAILPLSGSARPNGINVLRGIQVAAEMVNAAGGVNGRRIEVLAKDDENTPKVGIARAREMVAEKVAVVLEGWSSLVTLALQPVLARAEMLDITVASKSDLVLDGANSYAVRINSSTLQDAAALADLVVNKLAARRIGFVTQNDSFGNTARAAIEAEMQRFGKLQEVAMATVQVEPKQTDFTAGLAPIKRAKVDAVVVVSNPDSTVLPTLVQQYRQAGIASTLVAAVGTVTPAVLKATGEAMTGVVSADIYRPDLPPFDGIKANLDFIAAYRKAHNETPDKGAALGAQSLLVWATAANTARSLDRRAVAGAIRNRKVAGTIFGDMAFEFGGQAVHRPTIFKVADGKAAKVEIVT
jgi:branched-chain amino acid transport system substrate-binding protein